MVSAPLLLCFLLSLGYLTSGSDAAAGAAEGAGDGGSSPNAALATMASMGAGGDQRQMQRLLEGGTSVMGMLASLRNLVDDAAGACSAQCSAMCSAQCSAQRSAVQFNRVVRDSIAATARPVPRLVPIYPRCTALRCITTRLLLLTRLTDMVVVSVCVSRMHVLFVRARATL
jgi:hypothetical protein